MKPISKYLLLFFLPLIVIFSSSCEGVIDDISDMSKFRDSLQKVYPEEDISVNISNGTYLSVSFINSDLKKLKSEEKNKIAEKIGNISRNYFQKDRILNGSLTFVIYKNYIVYKYTESIDNYDLYNAVTKVDSTDVK